MDTASRSSHPWITGIRWVARVIAALFVLFIGISLVAGLFGAPSPRDRPLNSTDHVLLSLIVIELLGLVIAWKWELIGGIIVLAAAVVEAFVQPATLSFPKILIPFTALLFLFCWSMSRSNDQKGNGKGRTTQGEQM